MTITRGSTVISDIRRGSTIINEVRRGSTIIWQRDNATSIDFTTFTEDTDDLGSDWTSHGPSTDFLLGIENGTARLKLPDGLVGGAPDLRQSRMRYNADTAPADDGYIEVKAASMGSSGALLSWSDRFRTIAFSRLSNEAFTHGVGIDMAAGQCWITRMVDSTETRMATGGPFAAGNRLHLSHADRVHTLYRNGYQVAQWNDSGATAEMGAGYRSMGLLAEAGKDLLGPRRFSPALSSIKMA